MPKRRHRLALPEGSLKPVFLYGALLAAGAGLLQWLEYRQISRAHSVEIQFALVAALFLALGVWVGMRIVNRIDRAPAGLADGNSAARETLGISEREYEVLKLLASGLSNKEIASRLNVSPNTIKTHVARLLEKLDSRRRTEAIRKARDLGIVG